MKYWEYTDDDLRERGMYPLIPLQLFGLRKALEKAQGKNDIAEIKRLAKEAKELARKLAYEAKTLFEQDEILGEDFHKMLLAIQNLVEYLNRNYFKDKMIEQEVSRMTKTLYDPEVERRGIERGVEKVARGLLTMGMDIEQIIKVTGLTEEQLDKLKKEQ